MKFLLILLLVACGDHSSKLDQKTPVVTQRPSMTRPRTAAVVTGSTHVVICGDSPKLTGDDSSGDVIHDEHITTCTIVYGTPGVRTCTVKGGTLLDSSDLMFTVRPTVSAHLAYVCTKG